MTHRSPLVIGLGNPDRGDDAVGAAVARAVAAQRPTVEVVEHEDPTAVLDLWAGHSPVVVVDAVRSGAAAGTVHRLATGRGGPPISTQAWAHVGQGGTHGIGLAEIVELARALGRLPERLVVIGVEAERFDHGAPLSAAVAAAVPVAVEQIGRELERVDDLEAHDVPR
ncbi:hydrogenase maturation protease [Nocardioides sp.]|uniref:hydrogenase maturation protease n=1 Tax=Nocardioides sp. TaxID=35761 RepID=UPI0027337E91|nr:hydrogenase maturation protease [Nocardioides sp.]MDP3893351.1 hydrogenase maturation protease [Nocardioides sp.]